MKHLTGYNSKNSLVKKLEPKPAKKVKLLNSDRSDNKKAIATGITIQSLNHSKNRNRVKIEMKECETQTKQNNQ